MQPESYTLKSLYNYHGSVLSVGSLWLSKHLHNLRVELGHQDLDSLVRLDIDPARKKAIQRVQRVQVPAVAATQVVNNSILS